MKKYDISKLLDLYAAPVLTIALGLILLLNPDSASALIAKFCAWILIIIGAGFGFAAGFGEASRRTNRIIWTAVCLVAGFWLLANPLVIAKFIGRVLGLALMIQGTRDISANVKYKGGKVVFSAGLLLSAATALIGLMLVVLPMSTSRIFFIVCGIVLICVGAAELIDRMKHKGYLDAGDPDIIDVDKL